MSHKNLSRDTVIIPILQIKKLRYKNGRLLVQNNKVWIRYNLNFASQDDTFDHYLCVLFHIHAIKYKSVLYTYTSNWQHLLSFLLDIAHHFPFLSPRSFYFRFLHDKSTSIFYQISCHLNLCCHLFNLYTTIDAYLGLTSLQLFKATH